MQPGRRMLQHVGGARADQRGDQEARVLEEHARHQPARDALLHDAQREGDLPRGQQTCVACRPWLVSRGPLH